MEKYYLITFDNTHTAMNAEKVMKENSIDLTIMPTPTFITKSCGISIRIKEEFIYGVKELIKNKKINYKSIFLKLQSEYKEVSELEDISKNL